MSLDACLPAELRGPTTTITPIAAGLSGAGVYRVDAPAGCFVLKVSDAAVPLEDWRRTLCVRTLAAAAELTPRIVHADESHRAVVTDFVSDRSFPTYLRDPRTHAEAFARMAETVRRVHALSLPAGAPSSDAREHLAALWAFFAAAEASPSFRVPGFARDQIERVLAEPQPARDRGDVLSHNDLNPSNIVYDGTRLLLIDWDAAGANEPWYDLAALAVFLRMDDDTCRRLIAAYDRTSEEPLSPRFLYLRRLVAALVGAMFLILAHRSGHGGATDEDAADAWPSLMECYQRMGAGQLDLGAADGRWMFGLAFIKASAAL